MRAEPRGLTEQAHLTDQKRTSMLNLFKLAPVRMRSPVNRRLSIAVCSFHRAGIPSQSGLGFETKLVQRHMPPDCKPSQIGDFEGESTKFAKMLLDADQAISYTLRFGYGPGTSALRSAIACPRKRFSTRIQSGEFSPVNHLVVRA